MTKREEFTTSLKDAMKSKDEIGVATIRLITAAMKDKDIDARGKGNPNGIDEAAILSMLQGMIKQRQESFDIFTKAGRKDLADKEEAEIAVIKRFLPAQMSDDEVKKAIDGLVTELGVSSVKDMGKVMGALKSKYAGQMDMAAASAAIKARLAG